MRTLWGLVLSIVLCYASFRVSSEMRDHSKSSTPPLRCNSGAVFFDGIKYQYIDCDKNPQDDKCERQDHQQVTNIRERLCIFVSRYKVSSPINDKECFIKSTNSVLFELTSRFGHPKTYPLYFVDQCAYADGATICFCIEQYCNNWDNVKTMLRFHIDKVKNETTFGWEHMAEYFNRVKHFLQIPIIADATPDMSTKTTVSRLECQLRRLDKWFPSPTTKKETTTTTTTTTTTPSTTTIITTTTAATPTTTTTTITPKTTAEPSTSTTSTSKASTTQETTTTSVKPPTTTTTEGTTASSTKSTTENPEETTTEDPSTTTEAGLFEEGPSDGLPDKIKESSAETTTEQASNIVKESTIEEQGWAGEVKQDEKEEVWEEKEKCNRTNVMLGDDGYYKVCNVGDNSEQCPQMDAVPRFRTSDDEVLICVSIWHHNSHQERHPKDPRCVPGDTSKPVLEVRPMKMKRNKAQNLMKECRYSTKSVICSCQDHICDNLRNLENFFYEEMGRRPAMESGYNPKVAEFPEAKRQVLSFCIYQELVDMTHEPFSFANMKPRKPRSRSVLLILKALSVIVIFIVAVLLGCIGICKMWKSYTDAAYMHYLNTEQRKKSGSRQKFRRFKERLTKGEKADADGKKTAKPGEKEEFKPLLEEKGAEPTKRRNDSKEKEKGSKAKKEEEVDKGKIEKKETGVVKEEKGKESKVKKEEEVDKGKIEKKETEVVKEEKGKESKVKDGEKKKEKKGEQKGSKQTVEKKEEKKEVIKKEEKKEVIKKEEKKEVIKKESKEKKEEKEKGPKVEGTPKEGASERKVEEPKVEKKNKKAKKEKKRRAMTDDDRTMEVSVTGRVHSSSSS